MTQTPPMKPFSVISPGRVNLLGEHVDYNGGIVLPAAIDRAIRFEFTPLAEPVVRLEALDLGQQAAFSLNNLDEKQGLDGAPMPGFALYPAGVAWALQEAGYQPQGLHARYSSDLPIGAGLSSSAALEMGFALAWQHLAGWQIDPMRLAQLGQRAENAYVGVQSGLMDQFACRFGQEDHALRFDTRDLTWQALPLPPGTVIVIADSTQRRTLTGSNYNQRREECEEALKILQGYYPQAENLRDISPAMLKKQLHHLPPVLGMRALHVVVEIARVERAAPLLEAGDTEGFGELMNASHTSLKDLYAVSTPELDALVQIAQALPGCYGSRLTGAGFGGCTVSLVAADQAEAFQSKLVPAYLKQTGREARVFTCRAAQGVHVLEVGEALFTHPA